MENHILGFILLATVVAGVALLAWSAGYRRRRNRERASFIARYTFPAELRRRIGELHPEWSFAQIDRVLDGLRQYFLACLSAEVGTRLAPQLGMPSKAADDAWHAFIVITREYGEFCRQAFGRYLHHTPHALMAVPIDKALANTLHQVRHPAVPVLAGAAVGAMAVPLLFSLDRELGVPTGYMYDEGAIAELEAKRKTLLASHGGADAGGGDSSSCSTADSGCGDGGGGGCGGGGCGSS